MDKAQLEALLREILLERERCPVRLAAPGLVSFSEADRLEAPGAREVFTHDLFSLADSPRLGAGVMQMRASSFPWTLQYDEIDYIIEGALTIECEGVSQTALAGDVLCIPKGSSIVFSAPDFARFLYVTYPADWQQAAQT